MEYDFDILHRPGIVHQDADALSRLPTTGNDTAPLDDEIPVLLFESTTDVGDDCIICLHDDEEEFVPDTGLVVVLAIEAQNTDVQPVSTEELLNAQSSDVYCKELVKSIGFAKSQFTRDRHGFLVRGSTIDGALQKVIPKSLQASLIFVALSAPNRTSGRSLYVRHTSSPLLLEEHGERRPSTRSRLSLMRSKSWNDLSASEEAATLSGIRPDGVYCHGHIRTASADKTWERECASDYLQVFIARSCDPHVLHNCVACGQSFYGQLGASLWDPQKSVDRQWSTVCGEVIRVPLWVSRSKTSDYNCLSSAEKRPSRELQ